MFYRLIDSKNGSTYEQNDIFSSALKREQDGLDNLIEEYETKKEQQQVRAEETCSMLGQRQTDITTMDEYAKFDFQVIFFFFRSNEREESSKNLSSS